MKSIGDGLMLRSANPRDAIRLGLQLVHQLADQADFPAVRIGIHTGPALSNEGDRYGATVNVAARLCAIAPGGEIIVSQAARSAAGRMTDVEWSARHVHRLRNVTEPIAAHSVSTRSR